MKAFFIALCFSSLGISAQDLQSETPSFVIEKKDGTIIEAKNITINFSRKFVEYVLPNESKLHFFFFDQLKEVNAGMSLLRIYGWRKGYFIKVESDSKILATVPLGDYRMVQGVKVFILDKEGKILEEFEVEGGDKKKDIERRAALKESLKRNFSDCPKFLGYLSNFDYATDTSHKQLWNYICMTQLQDCN
ncbi:hypothetical protein HUK80_04285 [Flavobacterium sp. MAH-1]|uniref:DUF4468 domain-containing protein n=1 Tax=Flavobacterium agri TaxID=2743471 RepID=A0A7Y9C694_9FLAO|nr:hypothetical protein [Flavobacterium agri]NUY80103.1 hypothetical protein [Flavobacterium agri]NYA70128.1 hypothetical protein [Flavobacterium agri]